MNMIAPPVSLAVNHGVRSNISQILLLVAVNAFVGAMIGVERSVLPLLGKEFGILSVTLTTSFIVSFGITKAFTNLFAGRLADWFGRKRVLVAGWVIAIPVPLIVMHAPSWGWVVFANALLAVNQGLCWTLTLFMKIDLGGPRRRGFAAGINETIGYGCVALAAFAATEVAVAHGLRPYPFYIALGAAVFGLAMALLFVRETRGHVEKEHTESSGAAAPRWSEIFGRVTFRDRSVFAAVQAGMARNLADGMAWGLLLLMFKKALDQHQAGTLSWIMVACFALGQVTFGSWSDTRGRKAFIVAGMALIAASLVSIASTQGFAAWAAGVVLLGLGGSLMYPTVIGSLSDQVEPIWRATGLGVYRFWRDMGYAVGALSSGLIADRFGMRTAVYSVAAVCLASAIVVAAWLRETRGAREATA
jgi:MFS family permease